ncbi:MAG: LruC domain-containing protein [bacterium]|nr:LruC domain-containing protein [bacterium]
MPRLSYKLAFIRTLVLISALLAGIQCAAAGSGDDDDSSDLLVFAALAPNPLPLPAGSPADFTMQINDQPGQEDFAFQTETTKQLTVVFKKGASALENTFLRFRELQGGTPGAVLFQATADAKGIISGNFTVNMTVTAVEMEFAADGRVHTVPVDLSNLLTIDREIVLREIETRRDSPQANATALLSLPDADGDGVPDAADHFPDDPTRATGLFFPAHGRYTIAYEDLFPIKGDADFNDYVIQARNSEELNAAGEVVRIHGSYRHVARAAGYKHILKLTLPGVTDASYTLKHYAADGTLLSTTSETVENFSDIAISDRSDRTISQTNAHRGQQFAPGDLFEIEITPDQPIRKSDLGGAPYDLYVYVQNTRREVHFPGLFQDGSGADLYLDEDGFPWALLVPVDWRWMYERQNIHPAYEFFDDWYESAGRIHRDWYNFPNPEFVFENVTTYFSPAPGFQPPPGFPADDFVIEASMLPLPNRFGGLYAPVGSIYDIRPAAGGSITFPGEAARIQYSYDQAALADAGFVEDFAVFYFDENTDAWVALENVEVDVDAATVTAYTDHLTPFVLTALPVPASGEQSPAGPACIEDDLSNPLGGSGGAVFSTVDLGFKYYKDRNYTIEDPIMSPTNAATFAALGFEQALGVSTCNGSGFCGPAANHKFETGNNYITFTAHTDIDVYVMYDNRGGGAGDASWLLTPDWTDTGFQIETTDPGAAFYRVYRRSYNTGDPVALHGNRQGSSAAVQTNYWAVIKPQGDLSNSGAQALCVATPDTGAPGLVTNLQAAPGAGEVILTWQNPPDADFAGVVVRRSNTLPAPTKVNEGVEPVPGTVINGQSYRDESVVAGTYYYTVFALDENNNYQQPGQSLSATTSADTDGDGLSDLYESTRNYSVIFPGSPLPNSTCITAPCASGDPRDSDGDGVQDGLEVANGTDPTNPDNARPTITDFSLTSASPTSNPNVSFTLAANDDTAVTGYLITLTDGQPLAGHSGWQPIAPTGYTLPAAGSFSLYIWAKDLAGNVSAAYPPINVDLAAAAAAWQAIETVGGSSPNAFMTQGAIADNGDAVIVWGQRNSANQQVLFKSERRGGAWLDPANIDDSYSLPGVVGTLPKVAINSSGDTVIASHQITNVGTRLYLSENRGGVWTHPAGVNDFINPNQIVFAEATQVEMANNGDAIIVWSQRGPGVYAHFYKSEYRGGVWTHPADINDFFSFNGPSSGGEAKVAMANNGDTIILWGHRDGVSGTPFRLYKSEYRGGVWTHPADVNDFVSIPVNTSTPEWDVAMSDNGDAVIVWTQNDIVERNLNRLYMAEYRAGTWIYPLSLANYINPNVPGNSQMSTANRVKVAMDDTGGATIAWMQSAIFRERHIFFSEYRGGAWTHPADQNDFISPIGFPHGEINLAMGGNGDAVIVWNNNAQPSWRVFRSENRGGIWTHPVDENDSINGPFPDILQPFVEMNASGESIAFGRISLGGIFRQIYE